jgi:cell division protein ZapA (FtsZ GTPase activity inhibitor)
MSNSTFCLIPRGRRLASFRFLESLSFKCIPIILSNSWILPFNEVIDWSDCVIQSDERLLLQIPEQLRQISKQKIFKMQSKCLEIYEKYFSSIESIVMTALNIIEERIHLFNSKTRFEWNLNSFSANYLFKQFSHELQSFPSFYNNINNGFTAILTINKPLIYSSINQLFQRLLNKSKYLKKTFILSTIPLNSIQNSSKIIEINTNSEEINEKRFSLFSNIKTEAIFQLDSETTLTSEEVFIINNYN